MFYMYSMYKVKNGFKMIVINYFKMFFYNPVWYIKMNILIKEI